MLLAERGLEGLSRMPFVAGRPRLAGRGPKPERDCNLNGYNPFLFFYPAPGTFSFLLLSNEPEAKKRPMVIGRRKS
jgi:hypothetical protein